MRPRWLCVFATLLALGCGGSSYGGGPTGNPGPGSTSSSISVSNDRFTPSATTVPSGTTVTWTWAQGATDHNVTFDDGTHSATQRTGTYARTFSSAGSFPYHCTIHSGMNGSVTVQ
jgi:plastocyanin